MALTRKLDFIIAGTQKSGTTALHYFLEQHPGVAFPNKQELHFFDDDAHFEHGCDEAALHGCFGVVPGNAVAGECTPIYLYWQPALPRIRDYNPAIKLLVTLRNPIDRAFSHWNMERRFGSETLDFLEAINAEPERARESAPAQSRHYSYLDRGYYSQQLERAFGLFPRKQIMVIKQDDLRENPEATVASACDFLGIPRMSRLKVREKNSIPYDRSMTPAERAVLRDVFNDEIAQLEALLGWDCSEWRREQPAPKSPPRPPGRLRDALRALVGLNRPSHSVYQRSRVARPGGGRSIR